MKMKLVIYIAALVGLSVLAQPIPPAKSAAPDNNAFVAKTVAPYDPTVALVKELSEVRAQLAEAQQRSIAAEQVVNAMQEQRNRLAQQLMDTQVQLQLAQNAVADLQKKLPPKDAAAKAPETPTPEKK